MNLNLNFSNLNWDVDSTGAGGGLGDEDVDSTSFWMLAAAAMMPAAKADCSLATLTSQRREQERLVKAWIAVEARAVAARVARFLERGIESCVEDVVGLARRCGVDLVRLETKLDPPEEGGEHEESANGGAAAWSVPWERAHALVASRAVELRGGRALLHTKHLPPLVASAFYERLCSEAPHKALGLATAMLRQDEERSHLVVAPALGVLQKWLQRAATLREEAPSAHSLSTVEEALRYATPCVSLPLRRVAKGGRGLVYAERGPIAAFLGKMGVDAVQVGEFVSSQCNRESAPKERANAEGIVRKRIAWGCATLAKQGMCPFAGRRPDAVVVRDLEDMGDIFMPGPMSEVLRSRRRASAIEMKACCRDVMCEAHRVEGGGVKFGMPHLVAGGIARERGDSSEKERTQEERRGKPRNPRTPRTLGKLGSLSAFVSTGGDRSRT